MSMREQNGCSSPGEEAQLLLVAGVDVYYVSRMLGHASIQETVDTYGRWLPANRPGALDVLDSPSVTPVSTGVL